MLRAIAARLNNLVMALSRCVSNQLSGLPHHEFADEFRTLRSRYVGRSIG